MCVIQDPQVFASMSWRCLEYVAIHGLNTRKWAKLQSKKILCGTGSYESWVLYEDWWVYPSIFTPQSQYAKGRILVEWVSSSFSIKDKYGRSSQLNQLMANHTDVNYKILLDEIPP